MAAKIKTLNVMSHDFLISFQVYEGACVFFESPPNFIVGDKVIMRIVDEWEYWPEEWPVEYQTTITSITPQAYSGKYCPDDKGKLWWDVVLALPPYLAGEEKEQVMVALAREYFEDCKE